MIAAVICSMRRIPISTQIASVAVASLRHDSGDHSLPARSLPVMNVTLDDSSRCVSEMPAYALVATGEETPGTISKLMPAAASASASRSEERRVGKESIARGAPQHVKTHA